MEGDMINITDRFRRHIERVDGKTGFRIWSSASVMTSSDVLPGDSATGPDIAPAPSCGAWRRTKRRLTKFLAILALAVPIFWATEAVAAEIRKLRS
jgi:hypothetical protein